MLKRRLILKILFLFFFFIFFNCGMMLDKNIENSRNSKRCDKEDKKIAACSLLLCKTWAQSSPNPALGCPEEELFLYTLCATGAMPAICRPENDSSY
jgi:hypothetical protein